MIDDCSTDGTGDVARGLGVEVLRTPRNQGSKSLALNYALAHVTSELTVSIDADTILEPDAVERLLTVFADPAVDLASGYTLPRGRGSVWERGRLVEYLFNIELYRTAQDRAGAPVVSAGCFMAFRTAAVRGCGGFEHRTIAEDMHLTWKLLAQGRKARFVVDSVCHSADPTCWRVYFGQMNRWYRGFFQNLKLCWRTLHAKRMLTVFVWAAIVDSLTFPISLLIAAYAVLGQALGWHQINWTLFLGTGFALDVLLVGSCALRGAVRRRCVADVVRSLPWFYMLRTLNVGLWYRALYLEILRGEHLRTWDKGH